MYIYIFINYRTPMQSDYNFMKYVGDFYGVVYMYI